MGRKRVHSSQFSRKKQPAVKKKRENVDSLKKGTTRNVAVQAYNFLTDEKIDRLERVRAFKVRKRQFKRDSSSSTTKFR